MPVWTVTYIFWTWKQEKIQGNLFIWDIRLKAPVRWIPEDIRFFMWVQVITATRELQECL